ncbi:hypothetical protein F5X98DRAFT_284577 [Xylaria grammica]|nr:hypothetical protein F5X98DRAFT_284577 [Xylaria grammica]
MIFQGRGWSQLLTLFAAQPLGGPHLTTRRVPLAITGYHPRIQPMTINSRFRSYGPLMSGFKAPFYSHSSWPDSNAEY